MEDIELWQGLLFFGGLIVLIWVLENENIK